MNSFPFQIVREINTKSLEVDNNETEEELLGCLDQRTEHNDDDDDVDPACKRCLVLEQKIFYYQKKISWLRKSKNELKDRLNKVNICSKVCFYKIYYYCVCYEVMFLFRTCKIAKDG